MSSQAGASGPYGTIPGTARTLVAAGPLESTQQRIVEGVGRAMFAESASLGGYSSERALFVRLCDTAAIGIHTARQSRLPADAQRQLRQLAPRR